jgi:hypothetical protein
LSEEIKQAEVTIETDEKTLPWGSGGYFKTQDGLKEKIGGLKLIFYAATIIVGVFGLFARRDQKKDTRVTAMSSPTISSQVPMAVPDIKTKTEEVNYRRQSRLEESHLGKIKVFNLRGSGEIPTGSEARAILESGATNGIVKGRLTSPLLINDDPLLPEGTIIFGKGKSTEERLYVEFHKAILPSGEVLAIRAQAFDESDKIIGLKGSAVGTKTKKMAMGMGFGFIGGLAEGLQEDTSGTIFGLQRKRSMRDAALGGASKAALGQSQAMIDEIKNSQDIIEVKNGTEFFIIIDDPQEKEK